ncbi:hypothetical protein evm_002678 [Chilo suppressalis]|nr:hypothetical protein evm_002678 [Chilo suppressalis]
MSSFDDSDYEGTYEMCRRGSESCALPFDPACLENVILTISDCFDFRVILSDDRAKGAMLVTTGLAIAGGLIGRHYGGKIGAAVGGAIGGACGIGIVAISMRDIWEDIKSKLSELFDIVYDYLAGMGLEDYKKAAMFLAQHNSGTTELAQVILQTASGLLNKKIVSSLSNS